MDTSAISTKPSVHCTRTLLLLGVLGWTGCGASIRGPNWAHPGPAPYQRYNATQFDPYPQNDVGPEIVGGRPRDYAIPPSEVERARQQRPHGPTSTAPTYAPGPIPVPSGQLY